MRVAQSTILLLLLGQVDPAACFVLQYTRGRKPSPCIARALEKNNDEDAVISTDSLYAALKDRQRMLEKGIGKRYICRTQRGFLNVHDSPGDPFDTENIVSQLSEGEIVTSTKAPQGDWICHDGGGWSISVYEGFVWLEALDE